MPSRPPRPCSVPSCPNLVTGEHSRCPKHRGLKRPCRAAGCAAMIPEDEYYCHGHRHLNKTGWDAKVKRDHQQFYHTKGWTRTSKVYRQQHPICVHCKAEGIIRPADVVDHIVPIQDGGEMFDWDNLQSLCHSHHNSKTAKENARKRRR